ncbi:Transcription factor iws1 [Exophiala xenobiotica]|nr:Transcription factor iws1 [Exophiala xenobiotica]
MQHYDTERVREKKELQECPDEETEEIYQILCVYGPGRGDVAPFVDELKKDPEQWIQKSSAKEIRKGDIDLEQAADQEIEEMRNRMIAAAEADGEPVRQEVVHLLNCNTLVQSILDPQTSLLEAVRFFLEPLSDGSLQAYNIQRELFAALAKLPMNKETLISSGVDKVMLFYRKSKRADPAIKRQATKLMEQWLRLVLQRTDDYTKKTWARATSDPTKRRDDLGQPAIVPKATAKVASGQKQSNRARLLPGVTSYTIVLEVSTIVRR